MTNIHPVLEKLGINHISVSHIHAWNASPGAWAARYLHGISSPPSDAMRVGTVVEKAILEAIEKNRPCRIVVNDDPVFYARNENKISHMVDNGARELNQYLYEARDHLAIGKAQQKVEFTNSHLPAPMVGYIDHQTRRGRIIEIKTTSRAPANNDPAALHMQQIAFYAQALKEGAVIMYCLTRKQDPVILREYLAPELKEHYHAFMRMVQNYTRFLDLFDMDCDADELKSRICGMLPIDWEHFRMSGLNRAEVNLRFFPKINQY